MSKKKSEQLGMPFGTATNRLRKLVLFHLLCKFAENTCYRCSLAIETPEELSMEHKKAWQDNDIALFWSVENIAFSHLDCNSKDRRAKTGRKHPSTGTYGEGCRCDECRNFEKMRRRDQRARGVKT